MVFGADYEISDFAKKYKAEHPTYAPQGRTTIRDPTIFTEEEVRAMPTWEESVADAEARGEVKRGRMLIADSTPMLIPEDIAKVSKIMIEVQEPEGRKYYYALDPVSGGKKGTEVDLVEEGLAPERPFPGAIIPSDLPKLPKMPKMPKMPTIPSFPKIPGIPGIPDIGSGIWGIVLLGAAFIILLMALGYSGLGKSVGRVGESEYKRRRTKK